MNTVGNYEGSVKQIRKPNRDRLVIEAERAYKQSNQYHLDKLLRLEAKYKRRLTLARNGLADTQTLIRGLLQDLASSRLSEKRAKGDK